MRWRRSDIPDEMVAQAYEVWKADGAPFVDERLMEATGAPEKVVYAAMERAYDHGLIEYGVSLRSGWLTDTKAAFISPPPNNHPCNLHHS